MTTNCWHSVWLVNNNPLHLLNHPAFSIQSCPPQTGHSSITGLTPSGNLTLSDYVNLDSPITQEAGENPNTPRETM